MGFRQWYNNHRAPFIVSVFLVGVVSYLFNLGDYSDVAAHRRQRDIISDAQEVIFGELYDIARKREPLSELSRYLRTNEFRAREHDFDAISRELIMKSYRVSLPESNKVDLFDMLIDAGRIQGLQMSIEILDEIQKQHR